MSLASDVRFTLSRSFLIQALALPEGWRRELVCSANIILIGAQEVHGIGSAANTLPDSSQITVGTFKDSYKGRRNQILMVIEAVNCIVGELSYNIVESFHRHL
jgi:hypothetical protein